MSPALILLVSFAAILVVGGVVLVLVKAVSAPEAFEDEHGFHLGSPADSRRPGPVRESRETGTFETLDV